MSLVQNPWEERFGWFWWNAPEIFRFTEKDFDRKAKEYADAGVTTVINFSCSHFRMSYYPYWDELVECIGKIVKACHKYGIKVVEHHSAILMHNLRWSKGWRRLEDEYFSYSNCNSSIDDFPKLVPHLIEDPMIGDKHVLDWCQVDGRTGKISTSNYASYAMCFNNPDYIAAYLSHLDALVKTGLDGIMNDDVQFFSAGNACTCEHCRKKFFEETGYTLPQPEEWDGFVGDYDNPVYIAWIEFRRQSSADFILTIYDHYEKIGYKNLYPEYTSGCLLSNSTFCKFDILPEIWDFMFQENCEGSVQRCSIHYYMAEAVNRFALGQRKGVPSMSMFYPSNKSTFYAAFALSRSWGQLFTATPEGENMNDIERIYRDFEMKHKELFCAPKKVADLSIYFSMKTRDYLADAERKYMTPMFGLIHSAYADRLGVDMVFEKDSLETLQQHKTILMGYVAMATDEELTKLRAYAEAGGKLLILGDFAAYSGPCKPRALGDVMKAMGLSATAIPYETSGEVSLSYNGKPLKLTAEKNRVAFTGGTSVAQMKDGTCVGISEKVGNGEVIWLPFDTNTCYAQGSVWGKRRGVENPAPVMSAPYHLDTLRETAGKMMELFVETPSFVAETDNDELMVTGFKLENGYAIHFLNLQGSIPKEEVLVRFSDDMPTFTDDAPKLEEFTLNINVPMDAKEALLCTTEQDEAIPVTFEKTASGIVAKIPGGVFSGHAILYVKE